MTKNSADVSAKPNRLYYVDWLRVIAMLSIFFYHSNRFFTENSWHINNAVRSLASTVFENTMNLWMMPFFFVLSGAAVYYSLKSRRPGEFVKERVMRILVPLAGIGIFVLGPLQIYLERLTHGDFSGNFFQFFPHYFDGFYAFGGNFAWMGVHLWYLMDIFIFSLIALPLFLPRNNSGQSILSKFTARWHSPWVLLLFFPGLLVATIVTQVAGLGITEQMGSWDVLSYLVFFIYGYMIFSHSEFIQTIRKYSTALIGLAIVLSAAHLFLTFTPSLQETYQSWPFDLRGFCAWFWVLGLLGMGSRLLNVNNRFLGYANEAVLPFYILHQPIILVIGYFVIPWHAAIVFKYFFIVVTAFVTIMLVYEFLVRRTNMLRFLFGMKLNKREARKLEEAKAFG
jgi:glucan biosynthesis protein C